MTSENIISLFDNWCEGDAKAGDTLFSLIYNDLSKIARSLLKNEHKVSLSTGDMLNEALLRILKSENLSVSSAAHLKYLAARVMRNVLLDEIKKKNRVKHNGIAVTLQVSKFSDNNDALQFVELENTLEHLKTYRTDLADIAVMKIYGAMSNIDIAHILDKSPEQIKYAWKTARLWLIEAMQEND